MSDINGVIGIFTSPEGRVVCTVSDFNLDCYGGFDLHSSQRIRVKERINMKVIDTYCGPVISKHISKYNADGVVGNLRDNGYSLVFKLIGHTDIERSENDYLSD